MANDTALYDATNDLSELRSIISDSCELVSVTEEVFYPVQMIVDY